MQHYGDLDVAFHRVLREASGNARLVRVAESFNGQIRLLISTSAQLPGRLPLSLQEHEAIVRAVKIGDRDAAEATMRHHVQQAGLALLAHLRADVERGVRPRVAGEGGGRGVQEPADVVSTKTVTPPVSFGSTA